MGRLFLQIFTLEWQLFHFNSLLEILKLSGTRLFLSNSRKIICPFGHLAFFIDLSIWAMYVHALLHYHWPDIVLTFLFSYFIISVLRKLLSFILIEETRLVLIQYSFLKRFETEVERTDMMGMFIVKEMNRGTLNFKICVYTKKKQSILLGVFLLEKEAQVSLSDYNEQWKLPLVDAPVVLEILNDISIGGSYSDSDGF